MKAHQIIKAYMAQVGKTKPPTIAEFTRLPDKNRAEDHGGEYFQHVVANRAATSCARTSDILRTQIIPRFGKYDFDDLEPLEIEKWKRERLERVSESTVKRNLIPCQIFSA